MNRHELDCLKVEDQISLKSDLYPTLVILKKCVEKSYDVYDLDILSKTL